MVTIIGYRKVGFRHCVISPRIGYSIINEARRSDKLHWIKNKTIVTRMR